MPQAAPDFHFVPQIHRAKALVSHAREMMFHFCAVISGTQCRVGMRRNSRFLDLLLRGCGITGFCLPPTLR
jgi:hypothetical protein